MTVNPVDPVDPIDNIRIIDLEDEQIVLDPKRFQFNDASLSKFMEDVSIWYDYYSSKGAKAEKLLMDAEKVYGKEYLDRFTEAKQDGTSDKGADAMSRTDPNVELAQEKINKYKSAVKQLKEYQKSFDKAHSMAQNRGYMIRKEMEKLNSDIYHSRGDTTNQIDVSDIIGKGNG